MQNQWWMQPALQKNEAVLMPALPRRWYAERCFLDRNVLIKQDDSLFRPASGSWNQTESTELSTYVRPRGSVAGRGVLRAAGVGLGPRGQTSRPAYAGRRRPSYAAFLRSR